MGNGTDLSEINELDDNNILVHLKIICHIPKIIKIGSLSAMK